MSEYAALVVALLVVAWASLSGLLGRHSVTGPLVFVAVGYVVANPDWGPVSVDVEVDTIHLLAEVTLALVLFSDASRIDLAELRRDRNEFTRMAVGVIAWRSGRSSRRSDCGTRVPQPRS